MEPINTGGPATTMLIRDYFAGQALAGLAAESDMLQKEINSTAAIAYRVAVIAYRIADAMLEQREKR